MSYRTSFSQYELMLDFFYKNPQMFSGKIDTLFTKKMKDEKWEELSILLNAVGDVQKTAIGWRKTLKDWKRNTKKKAARISFNKKNRRWSASKEEFSPLEERLLAAMSELAAYGRILVEKSPICGDVDLNSSVEESCFGNTSSDLSMEVCTQEGDIQTYRGKRKIKNSLAAYKESIEIVQRRAECEEQKLLFLEKKLQLLERQTIAKEQAVSLQFQKLRQKEAKEMNNIRIKKLKYL